MTLTFNPGMQGSFMTHTVHIEKIQVQRSVYGFKKTEWKQTDGQTETDATDCFTLAANKVGN